MMKVRTLITILLAATILISCKPKKPQNLEEMARLSSHREAVIVKTMKLERSTFYHELISNGKLSSSLKAVVPFKVSGTIRELYIRNGQEVKSGDLLAVIDDFEYKSRLASARVAADKAEINFKDDLLTTYYKSDTTGLPPAKIKISRIRSGLTDALNALSLAEYNLNSTRVYSPCDGRVANLEASLWNPAQNYKSLCTVISDRNMLVEFPVIESEYGFVSRGMEIGIIPFTNDSIMIKGTITEINPQVDENGMIRIKAAFVNNGKLIDGMNVKVLIRKAVPGRLVVPKEALVIRQGRDVVFIRQDSLAIWKYVNVEFENSTSVSIMPATAGDGPAPGDLVIISGNINLAHETVVKEQ